MESLALGIYLEMWIGSGNRYIKVFDRISK